MRLKDFLEKVNRKENEIIEYVGKKALEAVKQNGYSLRYVREQTPEICLEAVKQDGNSLQYVRTQTPEICLEAVKQNGYSLRYVHKSIFSRTRIIVIGEKEIEISEESYKSFKRQFQD